MASHRKQKQSAFLAAIAHYNLTSADRFDSTVRHGPKKGPLVQQGKKTTTRSVVSTAKYTDGNGKTWTGRSKRPNWFKDALAVGKTAEDLLIRS
ncbi:H-NS histone family protein [Cupriavidus basilensis]|uniref:H-NS histone family protein n=1 Tax=Cupriavidus basilensis TaxID=68895 RepID=A0ABT6B588_9BURK|nr:H-NS histone family protein [Cupriavidus basilensis]MDF3840050.1 H-NS histone family protein [Cupriavidus basilensis]